eukprot:767357-Hanusia_phi.AAC.5
MQLEIDTFIRHLTNLLLQTYNPEINLIVMKCTVPRSLSISPPGRSDWSTPESQEKTAGREDPAHAHGHGHGMWANRRRACTVGGKDDVVEQEDGARREVEQVEMIRARMFKFIDLLLAEPPGRRAS